jgi:hypothetical protein
MTFFLGRTKFAAHQLCGALLLRRDAFAGLKLVRANLSGCILGVMMLIDCRLGEELAS